MDHRLSNAYHGNNKQHQIDTIHRLAYNKVYKVKWKGSKLKWVEWMIAEWNSNHDDNISIEKIFPKASERTHLSRQCWYKD